MLGLFCWAIAPPYPPPPMHLDQARAKSAGNAALLPRSDREWSGNVGIAPTLPTVVLPPSTLGSGEDSPQQNAKLGQGESGKWPGRIASGIKPRPCLAIDPVEDHGGQ